MKDRYSDLWEHLTNEQRDAIYTLSRYGDTSRARVLDALLIFCDVPRVAAEAVGEIALFLVDRLAKSEEESNG